jgi:predicted PurR-regulated permease PerM
MKKLNPNLVRQLLVLFIILFLGILIIKELVPYISGVLGAITLFVVSRNWMQKLVAKGWNKSLAAGLLMVASFIVILIPVGLIALMLSSKIKKALTNSEKIIGIVKEQIQRLEGYFNYNFSNTLDSSSITKWISTNLENFVGGTFNATISIAIMYFLLYYMLINQGQMKRLLISYIPLAKENIKLISKESNTSVRSNALGIPLVALFQGVIALIGYLIFGVPEPFFWFAFTAISSMIPLLGTALGILPVAILLFSQGQNWQAIGILIYGFTVVGVTDNLVRLYVLKKLSSVHPLVTLIGVIIGVPLFGFIGLIFGPLLISLFFLILKIYKKEYGSAKDEVNTTAVTS